MKYTLKIISSLLIITVIIKCTVTPIEDSIRGGDVPCFESDIYPLLVSRCSGPDCHNSKDKAEGIDLTSYSGILQVIEPGNPRKSKLIKYLNENGDDAMPPPPLDPLTTEQIQLLTVWIEAGAPHQITCNSSVNCDSSGLVSFSQEVLPVIDKYCYGCHSDADPQGGYSFTSYASTMKSVYNETLIGSIHFMNGFIGMPYEARKMPNCEISIIERWIDQGALNN